MKATHGRFDLALAYPQWQGSGRHENLPRGAGATARVCERFAPLVHVPISDDSESTEGINHWNAILQQFRSAQGLLESYAPRRVLTAGGDCAVDVAVIDYLNALYPDLTVIWVDSHLDANTPATTPSGNFHGMPVSAIMGNAPEPMQRLLKGVVAPERFFYVHAHVGDEGDWDFRRARGLMTLDAGQTIRGPVHIHFDLDSLDPAEFPHLAYPEPNGLSLTEALALIARIHAQAEIVGFTVTEFAPASDADAAAGSRTIEALYAAAARH